MSLIGMALVAAAAPAEAQPTVPHAETRSAASAPRPVIGPPLTAIVAVTSDAAAQGPAPQVAQGAIDFSAAPVLDTAHFKAIAQRHLYRPLSLPEAQRIARELSVALARSNHPFVAITVPDQEVTGGVLRLVVTEARLGQVKVEGARYFSEAEYRGAIKARPGEALDLAALDEDVALINRNRFRSAAVVAQPGAVPGTTDLALRVKEQRPWELTVGADNFGTGSTGRDQVNAQAVWGDAFGRGDIVTYGYSGDVDVSHLRSHNLSYQTELPWRDSLRLYAAGSTIHSRMPEPLNQHGYSVQLGWRYSHELAAGQTLSLGTDFKRNNTNLFVSDIPANINTVDIFNVVGAYDLQKQDPRGATAATLALAWSPGGVSDKNTHAAFALRRPGADPHYAYLIVTLDRQTRLGRGWVLEDTLTAQAASSALQASEQMQIDGEGGVRGYRAGSLFGDQGVLLRNTLSAPAIGPSPLAGGKLGDRLTPYAFLDWGHVADLKRSLGGTSATAAGAGLGARYQIDGRFAVNADLGLPLRKLALAPGSGHARLNITLQATF